MSKSLSNYFNLLNLEETFVIDVDELYRNYIKLQQFSHPDKLLNKSHTEKMILLEINSNLNKAYQVLKDDKARAEYLLSLKNILVNQEENNIDADPIMLSEILELNEEVIEADATSLAVINKRLILDIQECWKNFKNHYSKEEYELAGHSMIKLQYLNKISDQLKSKK